MNKSPDWYELRLTRAHTGEDHGVQPRKQLPALRMCGRQYRRQRVDMAGKAPTSDKRAATPGPAGCLP